MGYHRAGFDVTGVDIKPMPRFPFEFIQGDALEYVAKHGHEYDVIHASPPCQDYCALSHLSNGSEKLINKTRELLQETGLPYVIENVAGARHELINPLMLCGTMFIETKVRRHRYFECFPVIWFPPMLCNHNYGRIPRAGRGANEYGYMSISGHLSNIKAARKAMSIDWMTGKELSQAIPPAYTEWIGKQLMRHIT